MKKISMQQFLVHQPGYPAQSASDAEYLNVANTLLAVAVRIGVPDRISEELLQRMALTVVCYYQDIVADSGIWRSFVDQCQDLYGHRVPFYDCGDDYVLYELNEVDIRFLIWYVWAMCSDDRLISPDNEDIRKISEAWFEVLESVYDDVSDPEEYHFAREIELTGEDADPDRIYRFGTWLFMHCYLMTPAYSLTLSQILEDPEVRSGSDGYKALQGRLEQSMMQDPVGPLALYIKEWIYLIIEGRMPQHQQRPENVGQTVEHPYYSPFLKATGGSRIKFIGSYDELNRFFIDVLGWDADEDHLPQMKTERNFVLLVDKTKGMLLAKNIDECINHPENPFYDKEYARKHSIELLTTRGCCPADLLAYLYEHGCMTDASFDGSDDTDLVLRNHDFIARCYLQQYYRGD